MGFVASLAAEYLQQAHHPDFSIHHRHTDSLRKDFEQILLKSKYSNLLNAGHWRLIRRHAMICAPIWPPWRHVETIYINPHENLETGTLDCLVFEMIMVKKKTDTKLTKVESIVINFLGLPNLSEV